MIAALSCYWNADGAWRPLKTEGVACMTAIKSAAVGKSTLNSDESDTGRMKHLPLRYNKFSLLKCIGLVSLFCNARCQSSVPFPGVIELATLNFSSGLKIPTNNLYAHFGRSVSFAGDVNGDGIDDIILGGEGSFGGAYIIFGNEQIGMLGSLSTSSLNGTNGY